MKIITSLLLMTVVMSRAGDASPATPPDEFFDSNGVRIRYLEQGQGPSVILIHGYIGNADRHWINTGVFANLAKDHRVIAFDCRGHGKSDKPDNPIEIRKLSQSLVAANDPKALAAYHRGRRALVVTDLEIAAVHVPTLGIVGSADPALAGMRDLKTVMPALSVIVVDGAAHGGERGVLRRPEFLAAIREFLSARR